jgi:hypothetical protein
LVKKVSRKEVHSSDYINFLKVSENFFEGAKLASDFEYFNAAGVLIVHAAIALADAVTVRFSSSKSSGDNHYEIIQLLKETAPVSSQTKSALTKFERIIDHKNAVSYQGLIYNKEDIDQLLKHFERFSNWAKTILNQ